MPYRPLNLRFRQGAEALVNEAILAQYPDQTPDIQAYFQEGARRFVEFRAAATNAFMYEAQTRPTVKAFTDEQQRLARAESEDDLRDRAASELRELRAGQRAAPRMRAAGNARASDAMEAIDAESLAQMQDKAMPGAGGGSGGGGGGSLFDDPDNDPARMRSQLSRKLKFAGTETTKSSWAEPRRDRPEAGWWNGSIIG